MRANWKEERNYSDEASTLSTKIRDNSIKK